MTGNHASRARIAAESGKLVNGLWIGDSLPPLAELTIRSFQSHGFTFRLFTYGSLEGVPEDTLVEDASTILPESELFVHSTGSLAPASDWFRYRLLVREGGIWTDMDVACLRSFDLPLPWFALQNEQLAAIGLIAFPRGHDVMVWLERLAEDPATPMPWDTAAELASKEQLRTATPEAAARRMKMAWANAGPPAFTRAVQHFGLWSDAAPTSLIYPVPYTAWRHSFSGAIKPEDGRLWDSLGVHLWGEMLRRNPDAMEKLSPESLVAGLMRRHGCRGVRQVQKEPARILVGICSARRYADKRDAVRRTWLSKPVPGIEGRFFVGLGEDPVENDADLMVVAASDTYQSLPEKVRRFFAEALASSDFEWLFKCDDDTYLAMDRLHDLIDGEHDFVGNEFLEERGSPSGGAGYLLSRRLVAALAADDTLEATGAEDVILGKAAIRHGAKIKGTTRLCWNRARQPLSNNDVITSHWCPPERLEAIHHVLHLEPEREFHVVHRYWKDRMALYANGYFCRIGSGCSGEWEEDENGALTLRWAKWPAEQVRRSGRGYRSEWMSLQPLSRRDIPPEETDPETRNIDLRTVPVVVISGWRSVQRQEELLEMLETAGFQKPRFFTSELHPLGDSNPESITFNHLAAISSQQPPFLLLEDNARPTDWFEPVIEAPANADAIWLAVTSYGMKAGVCRPDAAVLTGHPRRPRISNMFGTHAILFLSEDFADAVRDVLWETLKGSPRTPHERVIAAIQEAWRVFGVNPPLFHQIDGRVPSVTNAEVAVVP